MILKLFTVNLKVEVISTFFLFSFFVLNSQNLQKEWLLANLISENSNAIEISGHPKIVSSPYGEALSFAGVEDALFFAEMPLKSLKEFTIEMIFKPAIDGVFEQRVVHMGEISGDRMLLEIRATNGHWYFDGFVASRGNKLALIDEKLQHPLGQWYHVAFVVSNNKLKTYVNGKLELSETFSFKPIESGQCSVGVRLNKRSWFKGAIYKIKVSPKTLIPDGFMDFKIKK